MLTSRCPSCSAPLTFKHAATVTAVCGACGSTVLREGVDVRQIGKVAPFARDLSAIRVGASGSWKGRPFQVAGVLRKGRARVRWNEWFLAFEDGESGWLAEGNGELEIFDEAATPSRERARDLRPGERVGEWKVVEVAQAVILAGEGELPFTCDGQPAWYADLRAEGRTGTLDDSGEQPVIWRGRPVKMQALQLRGLRAFTGWSDPTAVELQGVDVPAVRSLRCPSCSAPIELRAPGATVTVVCRHCGSDLALDERGDEMTARILEASKVRSWDPRIPLGARARLRGVDWQVIGAMERGVEVDGVIYAWTEYLLMNPYRGTQFLVESQGHWSVVERLMEIPEGEVQKRMAFRGQVFRHFTAGDARVRRVLGEFTWEVHAGDLAKTSDWVAPPLMLSFEHEGPEISWSLGTWIPHTEVAEAFKLSLPSPRGVAPHQPNPVGEGSVGRAFAAGIAMALIAMVAAFVVDLRATPLPLVSDSVAFSAAVGDQVVLAAPFQHAGGGLRVRALVSPPTDLRQVHVGVVNLDDGQAWLLQGTAGGDAWIPDATPGRWTARVESAKKPDEAVIPSTDVNITVAANEPPFSLPFLSLIWAGVLPVVVMWRRGSFEQRRWAGSDYG